MANAKHDGNHVPTLIASSSADGTTVVVALTTANRLNTFDGTTGTDFGNKKVHDGNYVEVWTGVSSADGITPVTIYADAATGSILTRST